MNSATRGIVYGVWFFAYFLSLYHALFRRGLVAKLLVVVGTLLAMAPAGYLAYILWLIRDGLSEVAPSAQSHGLEAARKVGLMLLTFPLFWGLCIFSALPLVLYLRKRRVSPDA